MTGCPLPPSARLRGPVRKRPDLGGTLVGGGEPGSQGIRGSLVCVNACACMYERAGGGRGKTHRLTHAQDMREKGECVPRRGGEGRRLALPLSLKPERGNIGAAGSQSKRKSCGLLFWNQRGAH